MPEYVLKIDGKYYGGQHEKYPDLWILSGLGAIAAKRMSFENAKDLEKLYQSYGRNVEIETYNPHNYLKKCLNEIIELDSERENGKNIGYSIRNNAQNALKYLEQIEGGYEYEHKEQY